MQFTLFELLVLIDVLFKISQPIVIGIVLTFICIMLFSIKE